MDLKRNVSYKRKTSVTTKKKLSEIIGKTRTEEEIWEELENSPELRRLYEDLTPDLRKEFLGFVTGTKGLRITYDPVFKMIFNPETRPERLEKFLSLLLKQTVKILRVMPSESNRLTSEGSLLVMDILVLLETGELVNVEIQRVGYLFPGARCACYSSDLVMRQYSQVREECRRRHEKFSYRDIKKVYTIVLIEESTSEFRKFPREYLHYGKQTFNTGLELDMIQEYLLIPLDIFYKTLHNIDNELEAWLCFLSSEELEDIEMVIEAYPEFEELYQEVFQFRYQTRELISMFSEALEIMDANTVKYMVEQQKKELEKQKEELEQQEKKLEQSKKELEQNEKKLEQSKKKLEQNEKELEQNKKELKQSKKELAQQGETIEMQSKELAEKEQEIQRLRALLEQRQ